MSDTRPLYIALTCDTVNDYFDQSLWTGEGPVPLRWRGVEEGVEAMVQAVAPLRDSRGRSACFTWFPPVDNFMEQEYGDPAWLLKRYSALWTRARERGDEIAWHAYQHRCDDGQWFPEADPQAWREGLRRCRDRLVELGHPPKVTRIGGTHCSNAIMEILEELCIDVDMTALPGRVRSDGFLQLDWAPTPEAPYAPSRADYRVPGDPSVSLLEIPLSMVAVRAEYDEKPFRRYIDLSFHSDALWPGLRSFLDGAPPYLVAIAHPSAVLAEIVECRHGLLSFQIEQFSENLRFILEHCAVSGRDCAFTTASQLAALIGKGELL